MGWDYIWLGGSTSPPRGAWTAALMLSAALPAAPTDQDWDLHPPPILKQPGDQASPAGAPHERYAFDQLMLEDPLQVAEQVSIVDQLSQAGLSTARRADPRQ